MNEVCENFYQVYNLLAHGVMSSGVVVSGVLLSGHELFRVEKLPIRSGPDFIYYCRLKVHKYGTGYVFSSSGF